MIGSSDEYPSFSKLKKALSVKCIQLNRLPFTLSRECCNAVS